MIAYCKEKPRYGEGVFIARGAFVIGRVEIGRDSSVFYNTVIRGDVNTITIGCETNIQDNSTLHVSGNDPLVIGDGVTVGHNAVVHGCTIGDNVLIAIGAIVLDGVKIAENSIVAAGSLVPPGKEYQPGSMIMGSPAKCVRSLNEDEIAKIQQTASIYLETKDKHRTCLEDV